MAGESGPFPQDQARPITGERTRTTKDYTTSCTVDQSPEDVFHAINNVRGWWSGDIGGRTDRLGAEFTHRYQDLHRSTRKITELVPGRKVVWRVLDAEINFVKDKDEWNGTDIVFEITGKDGKTELRFTHVGPVPAVECYGKCAVAWDFYINESLRSQGSRGRSVRR